MYCQQGGSADGRRERFAETICHFQCFYDERPEKATKKHRQSRSTVNQSINQLVNQSINQSVNQSVNQLVRDVDQ